jgi:hypothetical protein
MRNLLFVWICLLAVELQGAQRFADRFVYISDWKLQKEEDVADITKVLEAARKNHINAAVVSIGLDTLCKASPDYLRRLKAVNQSSEQNNVELIPSIFSVGRGDAVLAHDRNLAEGVPVEDAPFVVQGGEGRLAPSSAVRFTNAGFEEFDSNTPKGFERVDQPGEVSFADTEIRHGGRTSLRLEHFGAASGGRGMAMQTIQVQPLRCYRFSLWVKTDGLQPADALRLVVQAGGRDLVPRQFPLPASSDWRKLTMLFNSLGFDKVTIQAGVWGGKAGKVWLDDWSIEEVGPVNVLHRPGTPVTVRSEAGTVVYTEGKDFAPLQDPHLDPWHDDGEALPLKLLPGSRIHEGDHLKVSWYHSMVIDDSQVTVCMAEPALYDVFDDEARMLVENLHPRSVLLEMDRVRMGGTCRACRGHKMGELLGECITKQASILRNYASSLEVYAWSGMLDPNCDAHSNYYLVDGDFAGSLDNVPKNLIMLVRGSTSLEASLGFFSGQGRRTLVACPSEADNLQEVEGWIKVAAQTPKLRGLMFMPPGKNYSLLATFADLLRKPELPSAARSTSNPP